MELAFRIECSQNLSLETAWFVSVWETEHEVGMLLVLTYTFYS